MDTLDYFRSEKRKHTDRANEIIDVAKKEARDLTDEERDEVKVQIAKATEYAGKIKAVEQNAAMQASIAQLAQDLSSEPEKVNPRGARSLGEAFTRSELYQALLERGTAGKFSVGPIEIPSGFLSVAGIVTEGTGDNADIIQPQRIPGILPPVEDAVVLAELFGQAVATGNTLVLAKETVTDNNAVVTAEAAPKPASDIGFTTESVTLEKVATTIKVSTEMLEDEPAMQSYLNGRLSVFVQQREEWELVTDLFAQAGQTADASDVNGDNTFDGIAAGMMKVRRFGGLAPDAVVMSSLEAAKLDVTKSATNGLYFSGGPYTAAANNPWGLRRVISERIGDGIIVVGSFRQGGTIWRKASGLQVTATNSNEDDFLNNLTAIRAEERLKLFLYRPDAFCTVNIES